VKVSSSTTHGSLVVHSATPKGKLAADQGQSNNVIPVPPPQGAQLGGAAEVHSEGVDRDDAQQGAAHAPVDGVGARPPDSPHRQEHDKELEREDELVRASTLLIMLQSYLLNPEAYLDHP
jgi:hypothetical protein